MQRRYYLLALVGSVPLSGCTDNDLVSEPSIDSPEVVAAEINRLDDHLKIVSTMIAGGRDEIEIGDEVHVQIKVMLPVQDDLYDARLVISL